MDLFLTLVTTLAILQLPAVIAVGRTLLTLQDYYEGFLTFEEGQEVKVFGIEVIDGVEVWEAEIEKTRGYVVPQSVKIHKKLCTPVEAKKGTQFKPKIEEKSHEQNHHTTKGKDQPPRSSAPEQDKGKYAGYLQNQPRKTKVNEIKPLKKCCNKKCTAVIAVGRTLLTLRDYYEGFLTFEEGQEVKVFGIEVIDGVEVWEAEIEKTRGYVVPDSVKIDKRLCSPVKAKEGREFIIEEKSPQQKVHRSKREDKPPTSYSYKQEREISKPLYIFSSELIFKKAKPDNYIIMVSSLKCVIMEGYELIKECVTFININSSLATVLDYAFNYYAQAIIIVLLCWIILSSLKFRKQIVLKEKDIDKLVKKSADALHENNEYRNKIARLNSVIEKLERELEQRTQEKKSADQAVLNSQRSETFYLKALTQRTTTALKLQTELITNKLEASRLQIEMNNTQTKQSLRSQREITDCHKRMARLEAPPYPLPPSQFSQ